MLFGYAELVNAWVLWGFYGSSADYSLLSRKLKFDYPVAVHFHCVKCGICCGDTKEKTRHILLLKPEAEQISKTTLQPTTQFAVKIDGEEPYSYEMKKRTEDGKCVFLENDRCTIYSVRPLICRFFPFELNSRGGKYSFHFTEECQGIGKGGILSVEYFRKMFRLARARHRQAEGSSGERWFSRIQLKSWFGVYGLFGCFWACLRLVVVFGCICIRSRIRNRRFFRFCVIWVAICGCNSWCFSCGCAITLWRRQRWLLRVFSRKLGTILGSMRRLPRMRVCWLRVYPSWFFTLCIWVLRIYNMSLFRHIME